MIMRIPRRFTLYIFFLVFFFLQTVASSIVPYCRRDQRDALLEFKHEFPVNESHSTSYNMSSWNKRSDCCSWNGVMCEAKSGNVISLSLDNVFLNNTLKPNSALFKLQYLQGLGLISCNLSGEIPSTLGNLSRLKYLYLSYNELVGQVPTSIGNLAQLRSLSLNGNKLSGNFPVSFFNLTELTSLDIANNYFKSELPTDMSILHNLEYFSVSRNSFFGPLPESISKLLNLSILDLSNNDFIGAIPGSISKLVKLSHLDLSNNKLEGKVPRCLWKLVELYLSQNSFSSFEKPYEVVGGAQMLLLCLGSNIFQGPFPNWICKFQLINLVDLSNNSFSGPIPKCLRNVTTSLHVIDLHDNNFSGIFPDVFVNHTNLQRLDISRNQLEGKLPESLINCKALGFLNAGNNNFKDKFPSWLGSLPLLNVLMLRSNQFYGPLYHRHVSIGFQNLKVIDVSHNNFIGSFPAYYYSSWQGMTTLKEEDELTYMEDSIPYDNGNAVHLDSMEMVHKGVDTQFERIRRNYIVIDFSGNKFYGKIPESIGLLKGLRYLNLSSNAFTSDIPKSLANLTNLEALDVSQNQLIGQIPQDLGNLSFLSTMNFSHNNLEGLIPRSTQFQSQNCTSFMGNPKLLGLEEICGKNHVLNPIPQELKTFSELEGEVISWIAVAIAYGPGVFCGLVIGHIFVSHKHEWLMEKFHRIKQKVVIRRGR